MMELARFVEPPRRCGYLTRETASLEYRAAADLAPEEFGRLLERGYRRFGPYLFRPACPNCAQCRSLRVLPQQIVPGKSFRRVRERNREIEAQLHPLFVETEHVELYNRYHRFMHRNRGWPLEWATVESYAENFIAGGNRIGRQWLYLDRGRLVGVAFMDETPDAVSLVYCFYDPEWRPRSPGTFSILTQLEYATTMGLRYAYLGYWIAACTSMQYKARFRPHEILRFYPGDNETPVWDPAETGRPQAC